MRQLRCASLAVVCLLTVGAWAQGAPQVFVSTGTAGRIYSLNTKTGKTKVLVSTSGADYEGMVVAPDNAPGSTHPYLVYACDTNRSQIVRFDPNANRIIPELVYSNGSLSHPQCGRITSNGDLIVSSKDAGSGLWKFSGITNLELGSGESQTPTQLASILGASQGLAQKNTGDILVVDNTNRQVLRASFPGFSAAGPFITAGLSSPVGIARRSDGFVFVSDQVLGSILRFDRQGLNPLTCLSLNPGDQPFFMQASLDDTLYAAVSQAKSGLVESVNGSNCTPLKSFSVPDPAVGIALPPTTASQAVTPAVGGALVSFGFTALEVNQISGSCSGSVGVSLLSPEAIRNLIALTNFPSDAADPAVNLGLDGFEAVISTANLKGCTAKDKVTLNFQTAAFVDNSKVTNPEMVVCDDANTDCQPASVNLQPIGVWPINGYLPQDITTGGKKTLKCNVFLVNSHPDTKVAGQEQGTFCGFQSPLTNTFDPSFIDSDFGDNHNPALAATLSAGKSVPVKFKLAPGGTSNCQSAPYLTDAIAILSVAQIADSAGNPLFPFVPVGLVSNGSSGLGQPLFKGDSNQQYLFNWDTGSCITADGKSQTCPKGTYSLTVVFLTDNTENSVTPNINPPSPQSIYTSQTTKVILK